MIELLGPLVGLIVGIASKILYDKLAEPRLEVTEVGRPFLLKNCELDPGVLRQAEDRPIHADVLAYRVKIANRQKRLLNAPARNCVAWLDIDDGTESYQLSWVGSRESVTINVGDRWEIDVCGLAGRWGVIIAPTESGYNFPTPRTIGSAGISVHGRLRVTCENGQAVESPISIEVEPNMTALAISLGQ